MVRPDGSLVYFSGRSMDDMMAGAVIVWHIDILVKKNSKKQLTL